jgi:hypothetical protein
MLLGSMPKGLWFDRAIASKNLKKKDKKDLLSLANWVAGGEKGAPVFDQQCVKLWEEVDPDKTAIVISGCREDISNKVFTGVKPLARENVQDVKD